MLDAICIWGNSFAANGGKQVLLEYKTLYSLQFFCQFRDSVMVLWFFFKYMSLSLAANVSAVLQSYLKLTTYLVTLISPFPAST